MYKGYSPGLPTDGWMNSRSVPSHPCESGPPPAIPSGCQRCSSIVP